MASPSGGGGDDDSLGDPAQRHPSMASQGAESSDSPDTATTTTRGTPNEDDHDQHPQRQQQQQQPTAPQQQQTSSLQQPLQPSQQQQHHHHHQQPGEGTTAEDAKKARACEACRGLKVRCEPDPGNEDGPCKRCRKAGRSCVVTAPTRKRQKKTDSRVSELEKKIDALTASLQARAAGAGGVGTGVLAQPHQPTQPTAAAPSADRPTGDGLSTIWGNGSSGGLARSWSVDSQPQAQPTPSYPQGRPQAQSRYPQHRPSVFDEPLVTAGQKRRASSPVDQREGSSDDAGSANAGSGTGPWLSLAPRSTEGDIVDRGLMSMEKAAELFSRYKESMLRHLPAVVFPPRMSVTELRRTKPYLFLAVMAAAASEMHGLQRVLHKDLMLLFAHKIVVAGEKNLELVQALHVAVMWYWPPEHFEELKFYQLVHMAAVMALDIGLGKKAPPRRSIPPFSWREHQFRRQPQPDPTSIECRRTWLTCHYLAANTSIALHRPNLLRWTPFMTECVEVLETSPDAAPTDKYLCHLVWTHRMGEEIGIQFSMDDPTPTINILDARTQYALRGFERDLEKYRGSVPKEMMQPSLKISFHLLNLYMHEAVLHSETPPDGFRPPFNTEIIKDGMLGSETLSAAHINALSSCLASVDGIFATFLAMDVSTIRCLPVFNFVRVAYAVVVLMKMYFSAASPQSELGKVIMKDNMRVEFYLDALLDKFRTTAADDKCRPAAKFLIVLAMLRSWFLKQGKSENSGAAAATPAPGATPTPNNGAAGGDAPGSSSRTSPTPPEAPLIPPPRHGVNTPLQVLSEVAMGREAGAGGPPRHGMMSHLPNMRQTPQPLFHDTVPGVGTPTLPSTTAEQQSAGTTESAASSSMGTATAAPVSYPPPWMGQQEQPQHHHQQQQQGGGPTPFPGSDMMDFTASLPPGLDLESIGFNMDAQDMLFEGGPKIFNEPWFSDVFHGLPDPNLFQF
ncbi:C6 transcription factor (War1) [Purpureocillium lavendulum]|uniref:C6 transcription factor (War1) n=1 Tax=Purpureocillium lavendulum TaxID=1247861 RepID=A0AB34G337_9HYPO|nr:C6 transcription factor (War1) [Purpureocillium lavendulum]